MSNDLNRCEFIGRLGRDVETRYSPSGDAISNFTLAVGWKTKDKEGVEWVSVVAFGKLAEICGEYLTKGKQVYVSGRINTQKYKDKETGQDRYSTRIVADQMQMLGGRDDGQAPSQQRSAASQSGTSDYQRAREGNAPQQEASKPNFAGMDDDIPF